MTEGNTQDMFMSFQSYIDEDQTVREEIKGIVRTLEKKGREMLAILQSVHQKASHENIINVCKKARSKLPDIVTDVKLLSEKIPAGQYYRFNDHWKFVFQRIVFLVAFLTYLEKEELLSREDAATMIEVKMDWKEGFHLDLDDYLIGILQLASELARMCVNIVIAGDYEKPRKISIFMSELDAAFRLLNLKNDALRKRFDGLKYDLKKVEEVMYDLTIRGLKQSAESTT